MLRRVPRFVISAGALAAVLGTVVSVRGQHPHPLQTVKAGLVKPLNANDAQAGTPFYLKTSDVWQTGNCTVRANTMLAGQVESIKSRSDGSKREELALRFAPVSCEGNEIVQVIPVLIAMRGPEPPNDDRELKNLEVGRAMQMMELPPGTPHHSMGGGLNAPQVSQTQSSVQNWQSAGGDDQLLTGQVKGIHGVTMQLPQAGSTATTLLSSKDIHLERQTQFVLTFAPKPEAARNIAAEAPSATAASQTQASVPLAPTSPVPPIEEPDVCAAGGCKQLETSSAAPVGNAEWILSLAQLGLRPRLSQVRLDLDDDATVNFLGNDQVLVTFNPHGLTPRSSHDASSPRLIRALVLARQDGRILQQKNWLVTKGGQYLWSMGDGRVLVNVSDELVLYGPGLVALNRFRLPGRLLFASVSSVSGADSEPVVAVTEHEKHTPEAHQKLVTFLGPNWPIDEDYDLTLLDGSMKAIGTQTLDVQPPPVALFASGMVSASHQYGHNWKLQNESWDGETRTLSHFNSGCDPDIRTLPGRLLFMSGCSPDMQARFYKLLTADGATMLAGHAPRNDFIQQAQSSADGEVVAIAETQSYEPIDLGVGAHVSDFRSLTVSAYRVSDGKRILEARPAEGSALRQTFALAPSGRNLAVLTGSTLQFYGVTHDGSPGVAAIPSR